MDGMRHANTADAGLVPTRHINHREIDEMTRRSLVRAIANHSVIADWRNIGPQISQKTYRRRGKQTARGRGDISHTDGNRVPRYIDVSAASN